MTDTQKECIEEVKRQVSYFTFQEEMAKNDMIAKYYRGKKEVYQNLLEWLTE